MKISQISKIFDIPAETLRYIERQGLVHPTRSGDGQYREYGIGAFGELFDYMTYRKIGLPPKEIEQYTKTGSLDFLAGKMEEKELQLGKEIERAQRLKAYIARHRQKIGVIPHNIGVHRVERRPKYRYIIAGYSDKGKEEYQDVSALATQWRKSVPFVSLGYQIEADQIIGDHWKTNWILAVEDQYSQALSLPSNAGVYTLPEQLCLCSYAEYTDSTEARDCCLPALEYLRTHGYRQCGVITVLRMGSGLRDGVPVQYIEVMIPVERA